MRKVSAHQREWCSVAVLLAGRHGAQAHFLRWLKKSGRFAHLEVTGAALLVLKKGQVVKARAPIATLVLVVDLGEISRCYNARKPKHKVEEEHLNAILWKETIELDNAPPILGSACEPEPKKTKAAENDQYDFDAGLFDLPDDLLFWPPEKNNSTVVVASKRFDFHFLPRFSLAQTPKWIILPGSATQGPVSLENGHSIQEVVYAPEATLILLPPMPPGPVDLLMDEKRYHIQVISEDITKRIIEELKQ